MAEQLSEMEPRKRRARIAATITRALLTTSVMVTLYYILPLDDGLGLSAGIRMFAGLGLFIAVITWQLRIVVRSGHPGLRVIEAVAITVPLFLLLFATTYFLMSAGGLGVFSEEGLSRTDSLYLAVTTFATVGFGDISATSESARVIVMFQMILDLLILGLGVNAFVHAARVGRQRQADKDEVETN
jgi:voltage-gated potassium channel